jgi:hypothetical protein
MKLEIKHHTLLDLLDIGGDVQRASEAVKFGSWSERNPLAGKMKTCPHCKTRRREGVATVLPCCNASVKPFKEAKTPLGLMRQVMGAAAFNRKRKHPHRSAKKLQINEWRLKFEADEELMKAAQHAMRGLPGFWTPQALLGKGAAPSVAEQYVHFLRSRKAKALRARQHNSRFANSERSTHAKDVHAKQNMTVRKNWRKEVGLMLSLGQIEKPEAARILPLYPHTHAQASA